MPPKQGTGSGQATRRSTRKKNGVAPEPTSDGSGMISHSPTPEWSDRGSRPDHPNNAGAEGLQHSDGQPEEEEFMPTTEEVAATLVAMRSRRSDHDNESREVRCTKFKDRAQSHIPNTKQQESRVPVQSAGTENARPTKGTESQR